ncbi:hypothetical protein AYJ54_00760 [Bradyrhizobium centrolobii]|uniref:Uncharacterized protein n=1 Tax=Bradyrhizobium centrolobii TaxID=1505087 RepID=A0A176YI11_9BRAD|nr:hypothetical protein [Bradyrhizobium centrolobii]OAF05469.1 hypothetical protein AYJ54_00760 [Bradyrhizobium centrolobii]
MAGLLDYLYDPSGGNGGLLSRLAPSLSAIPQSAGFQQQDQPAQASPLQIGGYQMPRMGNADLYQPQEAAIPQNAQPTQGQMPQMQPEQAAGGFGAGLRGFLGNLHTGPLGAIIGGIGSAAGLQDPATQRANQTAKYLVTKGFDPALAQSVVSDPALLRAVLPQMLGISGQTDDIKEYEYAKRQEPSLSFRDFMNRKKAVSGEYSLNPVYGTDAQGNTVLLQTGKSGEAIQTKLPDGVKVSSGVDKVDLGTQWGIIDKRTGNLVGTQPKDIAGKEAAEVKGKAQGEASVALPGAVADAEQTKTKIDQLLNNEGLDSIVGPLDQFRPSWTLGEKGRDALARYNQLKGSAFLQAYGLLRGGGAITEVEGKKAEDAMARLDRAQSEADFRTALKDFRDAIDAGVSKLKARAGGGAQATPPASASTSLKQKYGLD